MTEPVNLTYNELKNRYGKLLSTKLKVTPEPPPSILDISGLPHSEEVISNWYAFFFNSSAAHGFQTLFSDTLIELITAAGQQPVKLDKCSVIRERSATSKRIDLLLYDEAFSEDGEECYRNAIIIENKINADLYNNLKIYYDCIKAEECKSAIVLSIVPVTLTHSSYINITHKQFLDKVFMNLGKYITSSNDKYLLLLKDLYQQISSLSKIDDMKEYVGFYFDHAEKIDELTTIRSKAIDAFLSDLNTALAGTEFKWGRQYPASLNIRCNLHPNILLILHTDRIFNQASYSIELWITYDLAKSYVTNGLLQQVRTSAKPPYDFTFNTDKTGAQYALVGKQEVSFTRTMRAIEDLPQGISADLANNWSPFIQQVIAIVQPQAAIV